MTQLIKSILNDSGGFFFQRDFSHIQNTISIKIGYRHNNLAIIFSSFFVIFMLIMNNINNIIIIKNTK